MQRRARFSGISHRKLTYFAAAAVLTLLASAAHSINVEVTVRDEFGDPTPARMHVRTSQNDPFPGFPDSSLMAHGALSSYFYTAGTFDMDIVSGVTEIAVSKGFEYRPLYALPELVSDTTLTYTLDRRYDMRSQGWYSGDTHVHTQHTPQDFPVNPDDIHLMAQAEDIQMFWCLDQDWQFTGGPHSISTTDAMIYYTTEYRHNALGHVSLLGLRELLPSFSCCWIPLPVYPMLSDTWEAWSPAADEAMILSHHNTLSSLWEDGTWPHSGFGRELPVQAALGYMQALDVVAYTNEPDIYMTEWYGLLNAGVRMPASVGTDAVATSYWALPAGGFRVYVKESPGDVHDAWDWVEGLRAGRTFVTNFPLIPSFSVNGVETGGTVNIFGPDVLNVSFQVRSVLPLQTAEVIRNGEAAMIINLPSSPDGTEVDTTVAVNVDGASWLAVKVNGISVLPMIAGGPTLLAHTSPIYVDDMGEPVRKTLDAGRFIDWIDSLEVFVDDIRGNWDDAEQRQAVLSRLQEARSVFGDAFQVAPGSFNLLTPNEGDTIPPSPLFFDWEDATDPEPGDLVRYRVSVSGDSNFTAGWSLPFTTESEIDAELPLQSDKVYWWKVEAQDRGGNTTPSTPTKRWFYSLDGTSSGGDPGSGGIAVSTALRLWPNPFSDRVRFRLGPVTPNPLRVEIVDVSGRRILTQRADQTGEGIRRVGPKEFVWDGRDARGRLAPSGRYWVRLVYGPGVSSDGQDRRTVVTPVMLIR